MLRALLICLSLLLSPVALLAQAKAPAEYRLGAGDVVRISVYQNPDLLLEARVSEAGSISYPLLGNVRIGGLGISAAEQLIGDGLKSGSFVKQPQVTLTVLQVRGHMANVLGQVNRPGRYPLEMAGMRLSDLLALAGGANAIASDIVVVTGTRDGRPFRMEADLSSLFAATDKQVDFEILNGDVIWLDRAPQIYIYGEVNRPGALRLERNMTVMQALASGGGPTQRGTDRGLRVHRKDGSGKVVVLQPALDEALKDGDIIFVRESLF